MARGRKRAGYCIKQPPAPVFLPETIVSFVTIANQVFSASSPHHCLPCQQSRLLSPSRTKPLKPDKVFGYHVCCFPDHYPHGCNRVQWSFPRNRTNPET